eukprot:CAMPEP_0119007218 /NCGR_PEP_ID=MMETSP1176-20130426/2862_1 /TAXON_ID=265551 /ORGANISM="Synedropsis recta cf, Strain CCMP1620" /LENGTH=435 /DNA_ID=CAMNT_0006959323 /DNA_START=373 /DNA_END=1680 /DNA_ORIENTATION=-
MSSNRTTTTTTTTTTTPSTNATATRLATQTQTNARIGEFVGVAENKENNRTEPMPKQELKKGNLHRRHDHKSTRQSSLKILIAKTISLGDIQDTVLDIQELSTRDENITVEWKIFCHAQETHDKFLIALLAAEESTSSSPWNNNATIVHAHFEEKRYKLFFWNKYLSPKDLAPDIQYIWMVDGDVPLRFMAWSCFWKLVHETYKPAIFEPAIITSSVKGDDDLYYAGKAHYQKCHASSSASSIAPNQHFRQLQAVETNMVDIQTPAFRRDAWEVVYSTFDRDVPGWGEFLTDYGPDFVWCKLVDEELLKRTAADPDDTQANDWTKVQQTCQLSNATTSVFDSTKDRPLACLILHDTPVYHRDTKSLTAQRDSANRKIWHQQVDADLKKYRDTFSKYALTLKNDRNYFRSFVRSDQESSSCQTCQTFKCMEKANMV